MSRCLIELMRAGTWPRLRLSVYAVLVVAGLLLGLPSASAAVGWRGGYETGDWSHWGDYHVQTTQGATAAIETNSVRQGGYAARFTTSPSATCIRWQIYASQAGADGYAGDEDWCAWSTMIARYSVLNPGHWKNLTSWHQTGTGCSAPMHVRDLPLGRLRETPSPFPGW